MTEPSPEKKAEWLIRAALKDAIVPEYFEVFPNKVILVCGECRHRYTRNLIPSIDEPVFVCPQCGERNWVPVRYA